MATLVANDEATTGAVLVVCERAEEQALRIKAAINANAPPKNGFTCFMRK